MCHLLELIPLSGDRFSENRLVCPVLRRRKSRCELRIVGPLRCRAPQDFGCERLVERRKTVRLVVLLHAAQDEQWNGRVGTILKQQQQQNSTDSTVPGVLSR